MAGRTGFGGKVSHPAARAAEWEMISSFLLTLPGDKPDPEDCLLAPVAQALRPFGIQEDVLCEISAEVAQTGETLRKNCPSGNLESVNVRVLVSHAAMRDAGKGAAGWSFFVIQQIASSESDNLEALENPRCFIDLHVYRNR